MEFNEISMCLDVKLDIYDKRPDALKFKTWTKCQVKIEAIKCLPCFLRITIRALPTAAESQQEEPGQMLCVSINVPGVAISLATSRTKQYSYGLFWTHNRRDCFIYFATDTDLSCRKHMKWLRKSIKNLELYRQILLEKRRSSTKGGTPMAVLNGSSNEEHEGDQLKAVKDALTALGPLPDVPVPNGSSNWSERVSRVSDIYEEIFEGNIPPRLSRRLSRASIASGIYEEMKPCSQSIIDAILEEQLECPPPLPPLPPHRKRLNTFETEFSTNSPDNLTRCNTNPETDMVKKKKYKNVLDNIFGGTRSKRSESVSESATCTLEDIIKDSKPSEVVFDYPDYANDILKRSDRSFMAANKRNSFSSPDLSKINFLDTFDEEKIAAILLQHSSDDLDKQVGSLEDWGHAVSNSQNLSSISLDECLASPAGSKAVLKRLHALKSKSGSMESLNISEQLPQNFNFSACNTSSINLVGSSGAVPFIRNIKRNNIVMEDDLTGYCIMAPIVSKKSNEKEATTTATSSTTSSTSSGYSTGSYCSSNSTSSCNTNSSELNKDLNQETLKPKAKKSQKTEGDYDLLPLRTPLPVKDLLESNIYENAAAAGESPLNNGVILRSHECTPPMNNDFTGNLYENLLTIKAAQELEQPLPANVCTSTPTDASSGEKESALAISLEEGENYYQTPRKSLISVDDKVPSYYPNSCDTLKTKRGSISPSKQTTPKTSCKASTDKEKTSTTLGLKHLVNIKMKRERKENLYITSPHKIVEQRQKAAANAPSPSAISTTSNNSKASRRSQNAQKISDNVYAVNLNSKKSALALSNNNNNITEKSLYNDVADNGHLKEHLHTELLQIALLQNIDFKFDDASDVVAGSSASNGSSMQAMPQQSGIRKLEQADLEYENCYRATRDATSLLHKYATMAPQQSMRIQQQLQHHLQVSQMSNGKHLMSQSTKLESPVSTASANEQLLTSSSASVMGGKKFASLPRFKKIDFSPLKLKINNVLQRNQQTEY